MTNTKRVENVLRYLAANHCHEVVICAGARNAPLVVALNSQTTTKVWSLFEERSASFFALGRIKSHGKPVAVITTSGTAAAELLPAAIEGYYSGLPLLLITADRPPSYRGSGAPQAIEQVGLFSGYVEVSVDVWDQALNYVWSESRPLHLNVCLDETSRAELDEIENLFAKRNTFASVPVEIPIEMPSLPDNQEIQKAKIDFTARCKKPVVIVGGLNDRERAFVKSWLLKAQRPVYLEALSGLCGDNELNALKIQGSDRAIELAMNKRWVDGVIRIGGVPTLRVWRDLEAKFIERPVLSFSNLPFTGLSRKDTHTLPLWQLELFRPEPQSWEMPFNDLQKQAQTALDSLLLQFPRSEPGMLYSLARQLPKSARVYVGNSLPIREWDLVARNFENQWLIEANRGANGIDGQLSTFLGFAENGPENWALLGDLTVLYDLTAPFILRQRPLKNCNIVVINNQGGKIFSRMYSRPELVNPHTVEFSSWAKMWNLDYERWDQSKEYASASGARVIELVPDEEETSAFLKSWEAVWTELSKQ